MVLVAELVGLEEVVVANLGTSIAYQLLQVHPTLFQWVQEAPQALAVLLVVVVILIIHLQFMHGEGF